MIHQIVQFAFSYFCLLLTHLLSTLHHTIINLLLICEVSVLLDVFLDMQRFKRYERHLFYDSGTDKRDEEIGIVDGPANTNANGTSTGPPTENLTAVQRLRKIASSTSACSSQWREYVVFGLPFVAFQYCMLQVFTHISNILITSLGTYSIRFECKKALIRGHDCSTANLITGILSSCFGGVVLVIIRTWKLHNMMEENANWLERVGLVVLGLPICLLKWHVGNGRRGLVGKVGGLVVQAGVSGGLVGGCVLGESWIGR